MPKLYYSAVGRSYDQLKHLKTTPSSIFGSCRYQLKNFDDDDTDYVAIFNFFEKYQIGYFFYIGGNDSMNTVMQLNAYAKQKAIQIRILGVPKTIDNDLMLTDHCPGYGSTAKYIAISLTEIYLDSQVYKRGLITVVEVMGRDAGWLAAAGALAKYNEKQIVDFIYLPEVVFDMEEFLADVKRRFEETGDVVIAVSEGIHDKHGNYIAHQVSTNDCFGHQRLGGVGNVLCKLLQEQVTNRVKCIEFNILQRCAAHCLSKTDVEEAYTVGKDAVRYAEQGNSGYMVGIKRVSDTPYLIKTQLYDISLIANREKKIPISWIDSHKNQVTSECIDYMKPLIIGEMAPEFKDGLPVFTVLNKLH